MTTNRVEVLERALPERPGRVDLAVEVPLPEQAERERLFRRYAGELPFSLTALDAAALRSRE
jgi:ATP-dependent 26S proteasome regulatory subunit